MTDTLPGVSVVLPVHNGARWLVDVLEAVRGELRQASAEGRPGEILVVEDGSTDGSRAVLEGFVARGDVRLLEGPRCGAAAAVNAGVREARYPYVAQVDQDVVVRPGWLHLLVAALEAEERVAAAQGHYLGRDGASLWARVMALDLRERYAAIEGRYVDHVCSGNSVYRRAALEAVGGLDESFGYGYDNDLSYRLVARGERLAFVREAYSTHHWRETLAGYLRQQYGVGYGRLDLIARHPRRVGGDQVSGWRMILQVPWTLAAWGALGIGAATSEATWLALGCALLVANGIERLWAGARAARRFGEAAGYLFPVAHALRNLAWVCALGVWTGRRLLGGRRAPRHSMASLKPAGTQGREPS